MVKYRSKPTEVDGIKFGSRKEAKRYADLKILERIGEIKELECHPKYPLTANGNPLMTPDNHQIRYEADFTYLEWQDMYGQPGWYRVIEDCKGYLAKGDPFYRLFALKAAIIKSMLGIEVRIT